MIELINAENLLGDSLYAMLPIREYAKTHDIRIVVSPGITYDLYRSEFSIPVFSKMDDAVKDVGTSTFTVRKLSAGDSGHICFESARLHNKQLHISEGFAQLLGIELQNSSFKIELHYEKKPKTHIGVAPFSRSCSRHSGQKPNKTLDDWKWNHLIGYLRKQGYPLMVFAGPQDHLDQCAVPENEYFTAKSYQDLKDKLLTLRLFVTVDNGLGHLASALDISTVILWPVVSCVGFIAPLWAPKTRFIQLEPNTASPAAILSGLRPYTKDLLNEEDKEI
jgi:hypothetical protein